MGRSYVLTPFPPRTRPSRHTYHIVADVEVVLDALDDPNMPWLRKVNLSLRPSALMADVKRVRVGGLCGGEEGWENMRAVSDEYCKVVDLKPIRAVIFGPPGAVSGFKASVCSEFGVPSFTREGLVAKFLASRLLFVLSDVSDNHYSLL